MIMESSEQTPLLASERPYNLGVALSGGGARGFAHAGALKALGEAGLEPDIICGVGAGSVVAVMYAGGVAPHDMLEVFENTGFKTWVQFDLGSGGIFKMDNFRKRVMKAISPYKKLEELPIKTIICATDLDDATFTEFDSGSIGERMVASCSIPVLFKPQKIGSRSYVDGGVLQNLPARTIRQQCRTLIGINCSSMMPFGKSTSIVDVAVRSYNLMARANQKEDMDVCDVVVDMRELAGYRSFNLKEIEKVYNSGYFATRRVLRDKGLWPDRKP